jgi:hypothetical protein
MVVTNQNLIEEELKRKLNSVNACCHSVQNVLRNEEIDNLLSSSDMIRKRDGQDM